MLGHEQHMKQLCSEATNARCWQKLPGFTIVDSTATDTTKWLLLELPLLELGEGEREDGSRYTAGSPDTKGSACSSRLHASRGT